MQNNNYHDMMFHINDSLILMNGVISVTYSDKWFIQSGQVALLFPDLHIIDRKELQNIRV